MSSDEYRPLLAGLHVLDSEIDGQGLFTSVTLYPGDDLGTTHYLIDGFIIIRTPTGGFINHSDQPNCMKVAFEPEEFPQQLAYRLEPLRAIEAGEELTLSYSLVAPPGGSDGME